MVQLLEDNRESAIRSMENQQKFEKKVSQIETCEVQPWKSHDWDQLHTQLKANENLLMRYVSVTDFLEI